MTSNKLVVFCPRFDDNVATFLDNLISAAQNGYFSKGRPGISIEWNADYCDNAAFLIWVVVQDQPAPLKYDLRVVLDDNLSNKLHAESILDMFYEKIVK